MRNGSRKLLALLGLAGWTLAAWPGAAAAGELAAGAGARIEQAASVSAAEGLRLQDSAAGGLEAAGSFTLSGAPNTAVSLSFAADPPAAGEAAPVLGGFTHDAGPTPATDAAGRLTVRVGAVLQGAAARAAGGSAGIYRVIVNY